MARTKRDVARIHAVHDQLDAYEGLGYLTWFSPAPLRYCITPTGGSALTFPLGEAEVWLSGLATGARGRKITEADPR